MELKIFHDKNYDTENDKLIVRTMAVTFSDDYSEAFIGIATNNSEDKYSKKTANNLAIERSNGKQYTIAFKDFIATLKNNLQKIYHNYDFSYIAYTNEQPYISCLKTLEIAIHNGLIKDFRLIPAGLIYTIVFCNFFERLTGNKLKQHLIDMKIISDSSEEK